MLVLAVISAIFPCSTIAQDTAEVTVKLDQVGKKAFVSTTSITTCDSALIVASYENVFFSIDDGNNWKEIATPLQHKTVVDITQIDDTIFVLTSNGVVHYSTNDGLSWTQRPRFKQIPIPNRFIVQKEGITTQFVDRPSFTANDRGDKFLLLDSTLYIQLAVGVTCSITSKTLMESSCIALSPHHVYVGMRRSGLLSFSRDSLTFSNIDMGPLTNEFVNTLHFNNGDIYVGVISGKGGLSRKAEYGNTWDYINVDRAVDVVDVLAIVSGDKGVYVGTREHGVLFLPNGGYVAYPIHDGLHEGVNQSVDRFGSDLLVTSRLRGVCIVKGCGTSIQQYSKTLPSSAEYVASPIGSRVIVGLHEGYVLRSHNDGKVWDTLQVRYTPSAINRIRTYENVVYICSTKGIMSSQDSGLHWSPFIPALSEESINDMFRIPGGWIIQTSNNILIASDKGTINTFTPKGAFRFQPRIHDVTAVGNVIYAAGYPGLFISENGGKDWDVHYFNDLPIIRTVAVVDDTFYVAGVHGRIYRGKIPITSHRH